MNSLIIPVYKNEASLHDLLDTLAKIDRDLEGDLECIFVIDGSPDRSFQLLREALPQQSFTSKLVLLSRNYGSYPAIRAGLQEATGSYFAVMGADLQEPPELILKFFKCLQIEPIDVVVGKRVTREDPFSTQISSRLFWMLYRQLVLPSIPEGGVDVFGFNRRFRDQLLQLGESRSSMIGQIFWLGFRRKEVEYKRAARKYGRSSWTLRKRLDYMMDSVFSFTDLPIKLLIYFGVVGIAISAMLGIPTMVARLTGWITVPGYATTVLLVLFFGALNMFGLGLVGSYAWRAYENTKGRPDSVVLDILDFNPEDRSV